MGVGDIIISDCYRSAIFCPCTALPPNLSPSLICLPFLILARHQSLNLNEACLVIFSDMLADNSED
eukprot:scaffold14795_cov140-Skeletonema_marinoi.AAC.5